jgi:preprotein translocase SecF subunit
MSFTRLAGFFLPVSALLVIASIIGFVWPGPVLSIEFTGGTLLEVQLPEGVTVERLETSLENARFGETALGDATVTTTRTNTQFVRTRTLTTEEHTQLLATLTKDLGKVQELQYTTIGPTVGQNLKIRALYALLAAMAAIILYVAAAFRKIPAHLSPWSFGIAAIIALVHDVAITLGIFTILSHYTTFQMDTLFVSAVLSIMGYSVSDTIVIFDRIRDNIFAEGKRGDFTEIAERSLRQTVTRTLNTGLGALIMLFALFFFGSESIRWFILALIVGTLVGTYSSFFIATPLLALWRKSRG